MHHVKLTDRASELSADFWAESRQGAIRTAALAAFHGQIDDLAEARKPIIMQLSTTTRLNSESLLKPQSTQLPTELTPPPVPSNAHMPASPTDIQAFLPLAKRYGCFTWVPNNYALARYEFAAALNNCMETINQLVRSDTVVRQGDLLTLKQLEADYSGELAALRFQFDQLLNDRLRDLEKRFPPTTKLHR